MKCSIFIAFLLLLTTTVLTTIERPEELYPVENLYGDHFGSSVVLYWSAPVNTTNLLYYIVYHDGYAVSNQNGLSYTIDNLSNRSHEFVVTAYYIGGESDPSYEDITVCDAYPAQNIQVSVEHRDATISWSPPSDIGYLQNYLIQREDTTTGYYESLVTTTGLSYTDSDLFNGSYRYKVIACYQYYDACEETVSSVVNIDINIPEYFSLNQNGNDVSLSWDEPLTNDVVMFYCIYRNGTEIATTGNETYLDSDLANGEYSYYVRAECFQSGTSDPTATLSAYVCIAYPPRNVNTSLNGTSVNISWQAPIDIGYLWRYEVVRLYDYFTESLGLTSDTSFTDSNPPNGEVGYRIYAIYDNDERAASSLGTVYVSNWNIPRNLTISISGSNVILDWDPPQSDDMIDGYIVYRNGSAYDYTPQTHYTLPLNNQRIGFYYVRTNYHSW